MNRSRSCTNPAPVNQGLDCSGDDTQVRICRTDLCPRNGAWGQWDEWAECSSTCYHHGGTQVRKRFCSDPMPLNGGAPCSTSQDVSKAEIRDGHRGGWWGGTPIVNFEPPHHKNFKWLTVGDTPIKISNWGDEIIKIAEKVRQNFVNRKKMIKKFFTPPPTPD